MSDPRPPQLPPLTPRVSGRGPNTRLLIGTLGNVANLAEITSLTELVSGTPVLDEPMAAGATVLVLQNENTLRKTPVSALGGGAGGPIGPIIDLQSHDRAGIMIGQGPIVGGERPPTSHWAFGADYSGSPVEGAGFYIARLAEDYSYRDSPIVIHPIDGTINIGTGINMNTARLANLPAPAAANDAATKSYVDARPPLAHTHAQTEVTGLAAALAAKLDLTGGTVTGTLTVNGNLNGATIAASSRITANGQLFVSGDLYLWDGTSMQIVTVGPADSAGPGFRALRVSNTVVEE